MVAKMVHSMVGKKANWLVGWRGIARVSKMVALKGKKMVDNLVEAKVEQLVETKDKWMVEKRVGG